MRPWLEILSPKFTLQSHASGVWSWARFLPLCSTPFHYRSSPTQLPLLLPMAARLGRCWGYTKKLVTPRAANTTKGFRILSGSPNLRSGIAKVKKLLGWFSTAEEHSDEGTLSLGWFRNSLLRTWVMTEKWETWSLYPLNNIRQSRNKWHQGCKKLGNPKYPRCIYSVSIWGPAVLQNLMKEALGSRK